MRTARYGRAPATPVRAGHRDPGGTTAPRSPWRTKPSSTLPRRPRTRPRPTASSRPPSPSPTSRPRSTAVDDLPERLQARASKALGWPALMPVQAAGHALHPRGARPDRAEPHRLRQDGRVPAPAPGARSTRRVDATQALVLCPTRELARQIHGEFERMNSRPPEGRRSSVRVSVYGGTGYGPQIDAFKKGAHLVVGTPGRVLDHLERGTLKLDKLRTFILDEADEMLSMGFYPDMKQASAASCRSERDSYMFSATMPYAVQRVGREFLNDPVFLTLAGGHDPRRHHDAPVVPGQPDGEGPHAGDADRVENPASAIIFCQHAARRRVPRHVPLELRLRRRRHLLRPHAEGAREGRWAASAEATSASSSPPTWPRAASTSRT